MLEAADRHEFDILVVWKLNRLSRSSLADTFLILKRLHDSGVEVVSVTESFDFTTPIGQIALAIIAGIAMMFLVDRPATSGATTFVKPRRASTTAKRCLWAMTGLSTNWSRMQMSASLLSKPMSYARWGIRSPEFLGLGKTKGFS